MSNFLHSLLGLVPDWTKGTFLWRLLRSVSQEGLRNLPVLFVLERKVVVNGPFRGLKLRSSFGSVAIAKILGTYEMELETVIENALRKMPSRVFVIGAAEGYYAAGIALRCPLAKVIAWEAESTACAQLNQVLLDNGLSKSVDIRGMCTEECLYQAAREQQLELVICDVEGFEVKLFSDRVIHELRNAQLIIETHDVPGIGELMEKIDQEFAVNPISACKRELADWPLGKLFTHDTRFKLQAMNEHRYHTEHPELPWLVAKPKIESIAVN